MSLVKPTTDFAEPLAVPTYMEPDLASPSLPTISALDTSLQKRASPFSPPWAFPDITQSEPSKPQ